MGRDQVSAGSSAFAAVGPIPTVLAQQWQGQADGANVPVYKSPGLLFPWKDMVSMGRDPFPWEDAVSCGQRPCLMPISTARINPLPSTSPALQRVQDSVALPQPPLFLSGPLSSELISQSPSNDPLLTQGMAMVPRLSELHKHLDNALRDGGWDCWGSVQGQEFNQ